MPRIGIVKRKISAILPPIMMPIVKEKMSISGQRIAVRMIIM